MPKYNSKQVYWWIFLLHAKLLHWGKTITKNTYYFIYFLGWGGLYCFVFSRVSAFVRQPSESEAGDEYVAFFLFWYDKASSGGLGVVFAPDVTSAFGVSLVSCVVFGAIDWSDTCRRLCQHLMEFSSKNKCHILTINNLSDKLLAILGKKTSHLSYVDKKPMINWVFPVQSLRAFLKKKPVYASAIGYSLDVQSIGLNLESLFVTAVDCFANSTNRRQTFHWIKNHLTCHHCKNIPHGFQISWLKIILYFCLFWQETATASNVHVTNIVCMTRMDFRIACIVYHTVRPCRTPGNSCAELTE